MKFLLAFGVIGLFVAGCATQPQVDWNSRIGHFTYQQAVAELGQPDKTDLKPDGEREAQWMIEAGTPASIGYGMGGAFATPGRMEGGVKREYPARPARYLHLTFGSNGNLTAWRKDRRAPLY